MIGQEYPYSSFIEFFEHSLSIEDNNIQFAHISSLDPVQFTDFLRSFSLFFSLIHFPPTVYFKQRERKKKREREREKNFL